MDQCPQCKSSDLVHVAMTPKGGPVRFAHCRHCEHRFWTDARTGVVLDLPDVLNLVAA